MLTTLLGRNSCLKQTTNFNAHAVLWHVSLVRSSTNLIADDSSFCFGLQRMCAAALGWKPQLSAAHHNDCFRPQGKIGWPTVVVLTLVVSSLPMGIGHSCTPAYFGRTFFRNQDTPAPVVDKTE